MPRLAFFIEIKNNQNTIENSDLDKGNPGIGGTKYLFLLTVKVLNEQYGDDYAILLTDTNLKKSNIRLKTDYVENAGGAIKYCENNNIDHLVLNANIADSANPKLFETNVNILLWAHNTLTAKRQKIAAITKSIKWVVCVSESQYNNMKDTPCFEKCTFVNNIIPKYFYDHAKLTDYSEPKVTYVGSLMPQKGAHNLLEIWRFVEKKCPDAQLYVFGGAKIWNENTTLGKGGAADIFYDRLLQKRLKKLSHPENIHFMGAQGWNYIDSFISTFRLGIVNPSYYMRDETFCLSAVEMAAHGLPIVSRQRHDGLETTIVNGKTGYVEEKNIDIAKRIIEIISSPDISRRMGTYGREHAEQFIAGNVVNKWDKLINETNRSVYLKKSSFFSKDATMLRGDKLLKIGFLIESGKCIYLVKKKLKIAR